MDCIQRKIAVRKTGRSREYYSRNFLFQELLPAAKYCENSEFAKFHADSLNHHIDGFNLAGLTASVQRYRPDGEFEDFELLTSYNVCKSAEKLYRKTSKFDIIRVLAFSNIGSAIINSDVKPLSEWLDTEIYHYFKNPLGIHHSATLSYAIPYKKYHRLRIVCSSNRSRIFDPAVTGDEVEFYSLPLFLGWMLRLGIIDEPTLETWLLLLTGMTPMRLAMLRTIVNIGRYQIAAIAGRLNITEGVVRNYITEAYCSISHLLPCPEIAGANTSQCVDLVRYYKFLNLVGLPNALILPDPQQSSSGDGSAGRKSVI
jgi:hypothetical protein